MSDESITRENTDRPTTDGQRVAEHVKQTIDYLRGGKVTRGEAIDVRQAAERAIADHDVARSIGRGF